MNIYQVPLIQFMEMSHELCLVAEQVDWDALDRDLSDYYCVDNGRSSIPIRKYFKARAGIEPVIDHVKHDHRMIVNYLSGTRGDAINTLLAALETVITIKISDCEKQWVFPG